jgi:uncharacterized membrane protein YbhN (UPF0104 family)
MTVQAASGADSPVGKSPAGKSPAAQSPVSPSSSKSRRWWSIAKRCITWAFFVLVAWLLFRNAREIEWTAVGTALVELPLANLAIAAALAAASYAVYSCYDLISRAWVGFDLSTGRVMLTTFISYAFNLNLGAFVGGLGFRYRLYSRQGLEDGDITRTIVFSMWTNWFGYLVLAGALFLVFPIELPSEWRVSAGTLRAVGAGLLVGALGYLLACAFSPRRSWTIRGRSFELPPLRLAALQLLISASNWLLIGAIVWTLLQFRVDYATTVTILLFAAVAGVITHVPAGVGVLEAVFVTLLAPDLPKNEILGALLAYRAVYYLGPLVIATLAYLGFEGRLAKDAEQA